MREEKIKAILADCQAGIGRLTDPAAARIPGMLLNLVEELYAENVELREENQKLKDEINRLKGEQGKPDFKKDGGKQKQGDFSTDTERHRAESSNDGDKGHGYKLNGKSLEKLKEQRIPADLLERLEELKTRKFASEEEFVSALGNVVGKELTDRYRDILLKHARYKKRARVAKLDQIQITREELCPVDGSVLPEDAFFTGYDEKVVQDLVIKADNVRFKKEVYYSPSLKKTFTGNIPRGYEGEFGPHVNSQIVSMKYVNNMSSPKIGESLRSFGVVVSDTYVSTRLTAPRHMDVFHEEKSDLYHAGLEVGAYQQIDDTSSRVDGVNHYTQIISSPLSTVFITTPKKDRLTILDVLRNFGDRFFIFNDETFELLDKLGVSRKTNARLRETVQNDEIFDEKGMEALLNKLFPSPKRGKTTRARIREAAAIAHYHQETETPIVRVLLADDAPQFKLLTEEMGLCWVHDGRHYKKLTPIVPANKERLEKFRGKYWEYYGKLFEYKKSPTQKHAAELSDQFDQLFSIKTGYRQLDERISKTKAKKNHLLLVLKYPDLPLHNNTSEHGARTQKRRQDVSLQTRNENGTKAKDTMMSIVETCHRLGVNAYDFIHDRVSRNFKLPSLAHMIEKRSRSG